MALARRARRLTQRELSPLELLALGLPDGVGAIEVCNDIEAKLDGHTRNHGLLHGGEGWRLSPAFDITPLPSLVGTLAPSVLPDGSQDCSAHNLLSVCSYFGVAEDPDHLAGVAEKLQAWSRRGKRPRRA